MAEVHKEAASTGNSQKKNSLLDEEIGKEFFSSWKSTSVKEDVVLDFNCESVPKGRKNTFNFDKLDMDFALDGDFDKISSFKVDMSDLDFSSPPKKLGNPKERTGKESIHGKHEGKHSCLPFAFDFNELDSFDLDSSLMRGEKRSDKYADDKGFVSPGKHEKNQGSKSNLSAGIDNSDTKKLPTSESVTTSKFELLKGGLGNRDSLDDCSLSISGNFGSPNVSHGAISPEKEITTSAKETGHQCSQQSEKTVSTESNSQHNIQGLSVRSVSGDDSIKDAVPELQAEVCSSGTEANTSPGGEQDISVKLDSSVVNSYTSERSPPIHITGSQTTHNEFEKKLENQNHIPMGDLYLNESMQGDKDIKDASRTSVSWKMLHSTKPMIENKNSTSKLLLAPLHSEPKNHKIMPTKERGTGSIHSKFFKRSEETESQQNTSSTPKKIYSLSAERIETVCLSPADKRRRDINEGDAQAGNQKVGSSRSHDRAVTKVVSVMLGSEKIQKNVKDHHISGFQIHPASLPERTTKSSTPECINPKLVGSNITSIRNSKSISVKRNTLSSLKPGKKTIDISCLEVSRRATSKNDLSHSTVQTEMKSLRHSEENSEMHVNAEAKMVPAVGAEKHGQLSPLMKRKTFEDSNADPETLYPLKCITESPNKSRKDWEASERVDRKRVRNTENLLDSYHSTSPVELPRDACATELEVPLMMENDGNVEKAEACARELEDICNMLKKKHEEAKEILVRAIVNNNNLLMLNHPIYGEKMVQRFATRMMSRELQT